MEEVTLLLVKHMRSPQDTFDRANIWQVQVQVSGFLLSLSLLKQISGTGNDFFSKPVSGLPRDLAPAGCEYDRPRLHTSRFPTFVATPLTTYTSLLHNVNPATSDESEHVHQDTLPLSEQERPVLFDLYEC